VNIYDMLRRFTNSAAMPVGEVADCLTLIDKLEKANAFGTVAAITSGMHEFQPWQNDPRTCKVCMVKVDKHE
jgi:hypothetical protein